MDADLLVGERLDRPEVTGSWRRMRLRHPLVYEIDDDVFHIDRMNWGAFNVYSRSDVQDTVAHCAEVSDLVTVTTEPLAEAMRRFNENVVIIPNYVPEEMFTIERPRRERPTIGWTGGASHALDVKVCAEAVATFLRFHPEWDLHIVGTDFRKSFGRPQARHTDWLADPHEYYRALDFDIGLIPLTDSVFNRSKTPIKAIELMALGIPVIATDCVVYQGTVIDGETGFLVKKAKEWRARLRLLAADAELRESMGKKARELAAQWTMERNWHKWADAYRPLLRKA